jgi:dihydrofolate reductase
MALLIAELSMSLDGYIAGPNAGVANPLGDGGEQLHKWMYGLATWREPQGLAGGKTNRDSAVIDDWSARKGAFVMGRRMFDTGEEPWGDSPPFRLPVFVLTHHPRPPLVKEGGTTFTFVTDGIESALGQAKAAAGNSDVAIAGGANAVQQFIKAGLLDELQIHLAPILLGGGIRLFDGLGPEHIELESTGVVDSPRVTHLRYRFGS